MMDPEWFRMPSRVLTRTVSGHLMLEKAQLMRISEPFQRHLAQTAAVSASRCYLFTWL